MSPKPIKVPVAIEAEQALIGAVLADSARLDEVKLAPEDFHVPAHGRLWRAILDMAARRVEIDAVTLCELLPPDELANCGGAGYVTGLTTESIGLHSHKTYAALIRDKARLRELARVSGKLRAHALGGKFESDVLVEQAVSRLLSMQVSDQQYSVPIAAAVKEGYRRLERAAETEGLVGITTGLVDLDEQLGGWQDQDLYVIGGRPGHGKTALMCGFALAAGLAGLPVGMVSAEQPAHQIAMRQISSVGRVPFQRIRTGKLEEGDWPRLTSGMNNVVEMPFEIWDRPSPDISEVAAQARLWKKQLGIRLLLVDYLQRLKSPGHDSVAYEMKAVAMGLKEIARELDIPVVALAAVDRRVDLKGPMYIPTMADLSDSSSIEKEADCVIFLVRPEIVANVEDHAKGLARLAVRKNRHGPMGSCTVVFLSKFLRFESRAKTDVKAPWEHRG